MATVPTLNGQQARTNALPDVRMNPAAFGGASQGLVSAATALQSVAADAQEAEDQRIKTAVARADVDWMTFDREQRLGDNGLFRKAGNAAVEARPVVEQAYAAKRDALLASATTQRERDVMTDLIGRRYQSSLDSIAEFTTKAAVDAYRGAMGSRVEGEANTLIDTIMANAAVALDPTATPEARAAAKGKMAAAQASYDGSREDLYSAFGTPAATRQTEDAKAMSAVHYSVMDGLLASGNVKAAQEYFDAHQPDILPKEENALLPKLRSETIKLEAETAAENGGVPLVGWGRATPALLAALTGQESAGNPRAESPKGAAGLRQIMPGTARDLAGRFGLDFSGMSDAEVKARMKSDTDLNLRMGEMYLNDQLKAFGGNVALALAAYNAGPGKAAEWARRFGRPGETISLEEWLKKVPYAETRDYVASITGKVAPPPLSADADLASTRQYARALAGGDRDRADAMEAAFVGRRVQRDQEQRDREQRAAEAVQPYLLSTSPVTSWTQIPAPIWNALTPLQQDQAREHFTRDTSKSDPVAMKALLDLYYQSPTEFARLPPMTYMNKLSVSDYEGMLKRRQDLTTGKPDKDEQLTVSRIMGVAQRQLAAIGLDPKKDADQFAQFQTALFAEAERIRAATGKVPDDNTLLGITRDLLRRVDVETPGLIGTKTTTVRGFQAPVAGARVMGVTPPDIAKVIRDSYARGKKPPPSTQQIWNDYREGLRLGIYQPPPEK